MKIMIVDGNSILNRAFYGIRPLTAPDGTPTNAIYGFLNIFYKYLYETAPDCVAVCFDVSRKTFRNEIFSGYKANRKGMPDELRVQLPLVKEILTALGFKVLGLEGYEADDLIGTLSTSAEKSGNEAFIITGDRDSLQLVNNKVTVLLPSTKMGKTDTTVYTPSKVLEDMGVFPNRIIDLKALMGDSSDNIPGVTGIGPKTAVELISEFDNLENLYENLEGSSIRASVLNKLIENRENAFMSKKLATINTEAPINCCCGDFKVGNIDKTAAATLLMRLNLISFMEKLNLSRDDAVISEIKTEKKEYSYNLKRISSASEIEGEGTLFYIERGSFIYSTLGQNAYICPDIKGFFELSRDKCTFDAKAQYLLGFKNGFEVKNIAFDIKLAAYLLEPTASSYNFSDLFLKYGEGSITCDYSLEFGEDEEAIKEALHLEFLYDILYEALKEQDMLSLLTEIEIPLSQTLSAMEFEGFLIDSEGIVNFDKELSEMLVSLRNNIYESAGCEFNINSPKQLGEVLFEKLMLPHGKKTKTGYSTNADVLNSLIGKHPIIDDILEYRKVSKLKSTYTEGLLTKISSDGRIHTTFLQTETRTGRLSSIEPNLQNIPVRTELGSRLREFFVADENNVLVDADYSQIELRVLAHISDDKNMQAAFLSGEDIHASTAAKIHDLPIDFVTPEMRRDAKAVNFGIVYGIGAYSLSQDIGTTVKEANRLIESYLSLYSGVNNYMKNTVSEAEQNGFSQTLFKRRRVISELNSSNKVVHALGERVAMNTPIQGTAADIIKIAMNKVYARLKKDVPEAKLILQVHDELIVECPEALGEKVKRLLCEEMENAASLKVKLLSDAHIGKNWLEAKG